MEEDVKKVETVLFTTGRFVNIEEISRMSGIASIGYLKEVIAKLKQDYDNRDSSLYVLEQGDTWKLSVKREYLYLTEKLLSDCELDRPTQETLAVIAYKTPIMQADVIKIRGNKAYDHIKILEDLDFVVSEKSGRTRILKVTNKFYDYFDIVADKLKVKLGESVNKVEEKDAEAQ